MKKAHLLLFYFLLSAFSLIYQSDTTIQGIINEDITISPFVTITAIAIQINGSVFVGGNLVFNTSVNSSNIMGSIIVIQSGSLTINNALVSVSGIINASTSDSFYINDGGIVILSDTDSAFSTVTLDSGVLTLQRGTIGSLVLKNGNSLVKLFDSPLLINECVANFNPSNTQAIVADYNLNQVVNITNLKINNCVMPSGNMTLVFGQYNDQKVFGFSDITLTTNDTSCTYNFEYKIVLTIDGNYQLQYSGKCPDLTITIVGISVVGVAAIAVIIIVIVFITKREKKRKLEMINIQKNLKETNEPTPTNDSGIVKMM